MEITVHRFTDNGETTLGNLFINGIFQCFTVEDQEQFNGKVKGETRIPEGEYKISLRKEGRYHNKYSERYKEIHKGMLCIHNAPNWKVVKDGMEFQYILIHTGNNDDHTMGCLLVNDAVSAVTYSGSSSRDAYVDLYPKIANAIEAGEEVTIKYLDTETGK